MFLNLLRTKTPKCMQSTLHGKGNDTGSIRYQNAGTSDQHFIWRKRTLPRTFVLYVFFFTLLSRKIPKCMQSTLYGERKGHYEKRVL